MPNLPYSMSEPDFMELVWENGEFLIRGLSSSRKTMNKSPFSSHYLSRSSRDGVAAESTLADPISGVSGLTKQQLVDSNNVQVNKSKEKKTRVHEEEEDKVNFSMFLRSPQALNPSSGATRAEGIEGNTVRPLPPVSCDPFENDGNFMARKMKSCSEPQKESVADEQSEAVLNTKLAKDNTGFKGNPEQIVPSSSFCSLGASNCPPNTLKMRYEEEEEEEDTDDLSKDTAMEEESEEKTKGSKGGKRKRKKEAHNLSERNRRDEINKKMRALKELIPNCNKVDKASMLDEAIEYLKNLQFQVQMMSIANGVYMPPMMFPSPSTMQHMNAQHLGGYSPMMGIRMQMGLGCCVPPQFPPTLMPGAIAAPPGIPEGGFNMFGLPDEVLLRSMSCSPFVSSAGSFTPQSVHPYGAGASRSTAATAMAGQVDLPGGVNSFSTRKDTNPT